MGVRRRNARLTCRCRRRRFRGRLRRGMRRWRWRRRRRRGRCRRWRRIEKGPAIESMIFLLLVRPLPLLLSLFLYTDIQLRDSMCEGIMRSATRRGLYGDGPGPGDCTGYLLMKFYLIFPLLGGLALADGRGFPLSNTNFGRKRSILDVRTFTPVPVSSIDDSSSSVHNAR